MEPATPVEPEGPTNKPAGEGSIAGIGGGETVGVMTMCTGEEARSGAGAEARTHRAGVTVAGAGGTEGEKS